MREAADPRSLISRSRSFSSTSLASAAIDVEMVAAPVDDQDAHRSTRILAEHGLPDQGGWHVATAARPPLLAAVGPRRSFEMRRKQWRPCRRRKLHGGNARACRRGGIHPCGAAKAVLQS